MSTTLQLKKMTIIAERVLRDHILALIREAGATGHTLTAVEGEGSRGVRASDFEGRNVQIDTIVSADSAERIFDLLAERYFESYAVIAYCSDVHVLRGEKFSAPAAAP